MRLFVALSTTVWFILKVSQLVSLYTQTQPEIFIILMDLCLFNSLYLDMVHHSVSLNLATVCVGTRYKSIFINCGPLAI